MSEQPASFKTSEVHHQLSRLAGEWEGTSKTWFEPNVVADESPVHGSMRLVLDGRFILHEYTGSFAGKPLQGLAIFGYHLGLKKFQTAWIDSFHNDTALMFSEGTRNSEDFKVLGGYSYITPEEEQHWGWRTELVILSDTDVLITAYNISPDGEEMKATELRYTRVA